jgi:hypothetical protein
MRFPLLNMPRRAWSVKLLPAAVIVAMVTGCGPNPDSPEVKKQIQERSAAIREDEAKDKMRTKGRGPKKDVPGKSIKGRLGGTGEAEAP